MASFRKRNGKWHVQIRKSGCPQITKSFIQKKDAQLWAKKLELQIETQCAISIYDHQLKILRDVLSRYRNKITATYRGKSPESQEARTKLFY
jgi:hypothetical protein